MNDELEREVKMGVLENEMKHIKEEIKSLKASLCKHMADEERDRKELDKKLTTQTQLIIGIGLLTLGLKAPELIPLLAGLL